MFIESAVHNNNFRISSFACSHARSTCMSRTWKQCFAPRQSAPWGSGSPRPQEIQNAELRQSRFWESRDSWSRVRVQRSGSAHPESPLGIRESAPLGVQVSARNWHWPLPLEVWESGAWESIIPRDRFESRDPVWRSSLAALESKVGSLGSPESRNLSPIGSMRLASLGKHLCHALRFYF